MIDEENGGGGSSGSGGGGSGSSRAMVPHRRWVSGTVSGRRRDRNQRWKTREFSFRIYWTEPWSITYRDGGVVAVSSNVASVVQEQLRGILHRGKQAAVSDSMAITTTTARRLDDERGEMKEKGVLLIRMLGRLLRLIMLGRLLRLIRVLVWEVRLRCWLVLLLAEMHNWGILPWDRHRRTRNSTTGVTEVEEECGNGW